MVVWSVRGIEMWGKRKKDANGPDARDPSSPSAGSDSSGSSTERMKADTSQSLATGL